MSCLHKNHVADHSPKQCERTQGLSETSAHNIIIILPLTESSIKNGNKRREVPVKKPDLLIVQRNVLATAISALNSKRRNINANSCLAKHGLVGNHALNDINVLLQMFNKPSRQFDSKSLNNVSDILEELQEEMGLQPAIPKNKMNGKSYRNNSHNLGFNDVSIASYFDCQIYVSLLFCIM